MLSFNYKTSEIIMHINIHYVFGKPHGVSLHQNLSELLSLEMRSRKFRFRKLEISNQRYAC